MRRSAARGATKRNRAPRSASTRFRDAFGQWDPKNQRPELWNLFNSRIDKGESIRVFPLSNWTELDVWHYIHLENIPIVPLYFAKERPMVVRGEHADPDRAQHAAAARREAADGDVPHALARLQSCTGAIRSEADTVPKIIEEMMLFRRSERENRVIDHDQEGSMEIKKREGYF